ncbi:MAG: hypothetical protein IJY16_07070 [Clostridia bacterium]|nr:hypothetical protein [Clostridia bacterium]
MNAKKVLSALVLGCVVFSFVVTFCGAVQSFFPPALSYAPYRFRSGYGDQEYEKQIQITKKTMQDQRVKEMPRDFVHYQAFHALGIFGKFQLYCPHIICPCYCINGTRYEEHSHEWKYEYEFEMNRTETAIYTAVIEIRHCKMDEIEATASLDALADSADMRLLDASYHGEKQNIRLGSAIYHYDAEGRLRWIKWEDGNRTFTLTVDTFEHLRESYWWNREGDMANYEGEGIMAELLNAKTAKSALREFRMQVALGGVSDETYIVIAVCAVAIALVVIFLIMYKKRGAPALAPAMAGVPTGEVSAGSDEYTSAAPSGAAPTAPENPTPPEEDTKADDFDRS